LRGEFQSTDVGFRARKIQTEKSVTVPAMDTSKLLKYALALFTFGFGALMLAGIVMSGPNVPPQMRYTFGIVLVLMGIYRFVITRMHTSRSKDPDAK